MEGYVFTVRDHSSKSTSTSPGVSLSNWPAEAVTNWGQMGRWEFIVCREPRNVRTQLAGVDP